MSGLLPIVLPLLGALSLGCAGLLAYLYARQDRRERERLRQAKADIADIMLLFQTMRDIVSQQKRLAREFNEELNRKIGGVKHILAQSLEKNERLYERQQALTRELEEARAELRSLQRQLSYARGQAPPPGGAVPSGRSPIPPRRKESAPEPFVSLPKSPPVSVPAPAPDDARLEGTGITKAPHQPWSGVDFGAAAAGEAADAPRVETGAGEGAAVAAVSSVDTFRGLIAELTQPEAPVSQEEVLDGESTERVAGSPAESAAARSAFRSLLDMEPAAPPAGVPVGAGNGGAKRTPIQQRVVEYHDAGMSIAEIAQELGIGKGEVRLMLSLARGEA
jgi:hypothetical protein